MDFYPYPDPSGSSIQAIFSIRNTMTNFISLICVYDRDYSVLNIKIDPASNPNYLFDATSYNSISIQPGIPIMIGVLALIIVICFGIYRELESNRCRTQGQPQELGVGFSTARAWVNSIETLKVYFGDFSHEEFTIRNGKNAALDICGVFDSASPNKVSQSWLGYYDILNFVWFQGAQYLRFMQPSGELIGFPLLDPNYLNVQCASELYLQDGVNCVTNKASDDYFLHAPTKSFQSKLSLIIL